MPIYYHQKIDMLYELVVWQITEPLKQLEAQIKWHPSDTSKYQNIKLDEQKREFLALRLCLKQVFGSNPEVFYLENGKPYLDNTVAQSISFSHTKGYAAIVVSTKKMVGIDLEHFRPSIQKLKHRILRPEEKQVLQRDNEVDQLLQYWGAKECMIKVCGNKNLDAQKHLRVAPYLHKPNTSTKGLLLVETKADHFTIHFKKLGNLYTAIAYKE